MQARFMPPLRAASRRSFSSLAALAERDTSDLLAVRSGEAYMLSNATDRSSYAAPTAAATLVARWVGVPGFSRRARVLDAVAGTGFVGEILVHEHDFSPNELLAVDGSRLHLAIAHAKRVYSNSVVADVNDDAHVALLPEALLDESRMPCDDNEHGNEDAWRPPRLFDAVVFAGAFATRQLSADALDHLVAATRVGGVVVFTAPCEADDECQGGGGSALVGARFRAHADTLSATGAWTLLERTPPQPYSRWESRQAFEGFAYRVEGAGVRGARGWSL